jgi:regulator of sirC expression with transglutaminase-like and TPR domain
MRIDPRSWQREAIRPHTIAWLLVAGLLVLGGVAGVWAQQMDWLLKEAVDEHKAGNLSKAIEIYSDYLKKNPRSAEAFNWRGMAYDNQGKLDQALADYNQAINLDPKYADAFNNRGEVYRQKKDFPKAMKDFLEAVKLEPTFAEPLYNVGLVHEAQGKKDLAAKSFNDYLKAKPDAPDKLEIMKKIQALQARPAAPPGAPAPPAAEAPKPPVAEAPKPPVAEAPKPPPAQPPGPPKPAPPPEQVAKPAPGTPPPAPAPPGRPAPPPPPPTAGVKPGPPAKVLPPGQPTPVPGLPFDLDAIPQAGPWIALMMGMGIFVVIAVFLVPYLIWSVLLFLIARKARASAPWAAFIPIVHWFYPIIVARKPILWVLLLLLPSVVTVALPMAGLGLDPGIMNAVNGLMGLVTLILWIVIWIGVAQVRGKAVKWGILAGIPCTAIIGWPYLAFSE